MKLRESGMPEEAYWETLFDVELIMAHMGIDDTLRDIVELGCGYGTFTLPAARRISGLLRAYDIDPAMTARTRERALDGGLANVVCIERDVFADGFDVAPASQDAALLFNILHCEDPLRLLNESARAVRSGGHALVIHWRHDSATPRGPDLNIRPKPEKAADWARQTGLFTHDNVILDLPPWHYGLRLQRR